MGAVDGEAGRRGARRQGPLAGHLHGGGVDLRHGALLLEIHIQLAVAGGDGELGTGPEIDRPEALPGGGVS